MCEEGALCGFYGLCDEEEEEAEDVVVYWLVLCEGEEEDEVSLMMKLYIKFYDNVRWPKGPFFLWVSFCVWNWL